jgi:hypothetical protein
MKAVYRCLDYDVVEGVLVVWDPELVGMVNTSDDFEELIEGMHYNGIVCPEIYCQASGITKVVFKSIK